MRFKRQQTGSQMPELNLVPMLDVLMSILTFFIIVSMTLTAGTGSSVKVRLPSAIGEGGTTQEKLPDPLIITLNQQGQLYVRSQVSQIEQAMPEVVNYLKANPQGVVLLRADRQLPYEKVVQVLGQLRNVGGDRVSLAIEG
ncbi:MAG: biopolymer transporter ExbD [Synechococcales bacterium]|nr:biopolymer transporter ExbD [Synechococcales bacterium]